MEIDINTKNDIDRIAIKFNAISKYCLDEVSTITKQLNSFIDEKELSIVDVGIEESLHTLGAYSLRLGIPAAEDFKILRAREFKEDRDKKPCYTDVDELSYPPSENAVLGRCNKNLEPIYYACLYSPKSSGNHHVAFSEVDAEKGDRINVLKSKFNGKVYLVYIGIWNHVFRDVQPYILFPNQWEYYKIVYEYMKEQFDENLLTAYQICDAFFADILRRKGSDRLYRVTSILSAKFLESGEVDGILYTSVKSEGSPVIALSTNATDNKLEHIGAESFEIIDDYGYAKFKAKKLFEGSIEKSGNIVWTKVNE